MRKLTDEDRKARAERMRELGKASKGKKLSQETKDKMSQTAKFKAAMKVNIYDWLKTQMLNNSENGVPVIQDFTNKVIQSATEDPNSKCGQLLAECIFKDNLLDMMDKDNDSQIARDKDFQIYRLQKQFYDKQRSIMMDVNKFRKMIAITSRRTGKTTVSSGIITQEAATPNSNITYINLTFSNAIQQIFDKVIMYSESIGLIISKSSKSEGIIEWANGSVLKICGNSNNAEADKLRGFNCRLAIIDEIGHQRNCDYLINEVLLPQMVDYPDSTILLCGTPSRLPRHFSTDIFNDKTNSWKKYHFTMFDNPFISNPQQFIEDLCHDKGLSIDSPFIQREYYGEFKEDTECIIFKGHKTYTDLSKELDDFNPIGIAIGCDYGYQDYNGIVSVLYSRYKAIVIKESKFNKAPVSAIISSVKEHYEHCQALIKQHKWNIPIKIYADTNEESITRELMIKEHLPAFNCYKYDKMYAVEVLAEMCRTGKMIVPKDGYCDDEMKCTLYERDAATDEITTEISDDYHPDILMALLYASRRVFFDMGLDVKYKEAEVERVWKPEDNMLQNKPQFTNNSQFEDIGVVG